MNIMRSTNSKSDSATKGMLNRRQFLGGALTVAASAESFATLSNLAAAPPPEPKPVEFRRKIKLGVVGNGGRGAWIARLFQKHGGYEAHAVADYFQAVADKCGDELGVDKARRFSSLSGYKKLIESGVEAVAVANVPRFHAERLVDLPTDTANFRLMDRRAVEQFRRFREHSRFGRGL